MDRRDEPICHPVRRPLREISGLTPWGQSANPQQTSQEPYLHKISDITRRMRQFICNEEATHSRSNCIWTPGARAVQKGIAIADLTRPAPGALDRWRRAMRLRHGSETAGRVSERETHAAAG